MSGTELGSRFDFHQKGFHQKPTNFRHSVGELGVLTKRCEGTVCVHAGPWQGPEAQIFIIRWLLCFSFGLIHDDIQFGWGCEARAGNSFVFYGGGQCLGRQIEKSTPLWQKLLVFFWAVQAFCLCKGVLGKQIPYPPRLLTHVFCWFGEVVASPQISTL